MFVDFLFLFLMFFFLAVSFVLIISYFSNHAKKDRKATKYYGVSILIPVWNEEKTVASTLNSIIEMKKKYKGKFEVIVIDNNSTDKSQQIVKEYCKKYDFIRLVFEKEKQGKSFAVNRGINEARNELVVTIDADSFPHPDSLNSIIGYFDDPTVGAVATKLRVRNPKNFVEKFQNIEYFYSNFYMLSLNFLEAIFVTRGPLSVFRKSILQKIGGFVDAKITPTEDMEITFRIRKEGYRVEVSKDAVVETKCMSSYKALFKQRLRWNTGTIKTFWLHRDMLLNKKYDSFGMWVGPTVMFSYIILVFVIYYLIRELIRNYNFFYGLIWNLVHGIPFDFSGIALAFNHPFFYLPYYFLFVFTAIFILILVYFLAFRESKTEIGANIIAFVFYIFIYYLFLIFCNAYSIMLLILRKSPAWR